MPAAVVALLLWLFLRAHGGFYQRSWSMAEVVFLFAAASLVLLRGLPLSRNAVAFIGALGLLAGWTALSALWSESVPRSIEEVQRGVIYPAAMIALLVARPARLTVAGGVLAAAVAVCGWALLQRLAPDVFGPGVVPYDHRLAEPVGYANGMGLLAVIGLLLAIAVTCLAKRWWFRASAGAATVPLTAALTFTFSRGSWVALTAGLITAMLLGQRLRTAAIAVSLGVPAVLVVWLCVSSRTLAVGTPSAALRHHGHRVLLILALLAVASAALSVLLPRLRPSLSPRERLLIGTAAAVAPVVAALAATAPYGGPLRVVERAAASFSAQPPRALRGNIKPVADPRVRLFDAHGSGRAQLWRVALRDFQAHPVLGSGAGTYGIEWARERTSPLLIEDAHSLYLETLAELGPVGLVLLLAALVAPLLQRRHSPLVGAYVAFLVHAGYDWDWELAALTCVGLACGAALLLEPRRELPLAPSRVRAALATPLFALLAAACVGAIGSVALARAESAVARKAWPVALSQADQAAHWLPWQSDAWMLLGEARRGLGERGAAAAAFRIGLRHDPDDWRLWLQLSAVTSGQGHRCAIAHVRALNPGALTSAGRRGSDD